MREALTEIAIDLDEGADIVIVKPAMAYLDVIRMARDAFDAPIVAYNVSGEYAMIKAAAQLGWIDERKVALETLTSIKRAGAGRIITYYAKDAARWLREGEQSSRRAVDVLSEWEVTLPSASPLAARRSCEQRRLGLSAATRQRQLEVHLFQGRAGVATT